MLLQQTFRAFVTFFGFTVLTLNSSSRLSFLRMSAVAIFSPVVLELGVDFVATFFQDVNVINIGMCGEIVLAQPVEDITRKCVVKKFSLLTEDAIRNKSLFENEVTFMQGMYHPYLAQCFLAIQCPRYLAISMDYYQGGTLNHHVGHVSIELSELCVIQVACALRYMHRNNLAHLDVKLENIFLDGEFNAILGDFGLSVALSPQQQTLPRWQCGGTPSYFAPEHRRATPEEQLNPYKMDAYCLGVVLWCLVSEREPHVDINYYYEVRRRRDMIPYIRDMLLRLLHRDPRRRVTVAEFLDRVRHETMYRHIIRHY